MRSNLFISPQTFYKSSAKIQPYKHVKTNIVYITNRYDPNISELAKSINYVGSAIGWMCIVILVMTVVWSIFRS